MACPHRFSPWHPSPYTYHTYTIHFLIPKIQILRKERKVEGSSIIFRNYRDEARYTNSIIHPQPYAYQPKQFPHSEVLIIILITLFLWNSSLVSLFCSPMKLQKRDNFKETKLFLPYDLSSHLYSTNIPFFSFSLVSRWY